MRLGKVYNQETMPPDGLPAFIAVVHAAGRRLHERGVVLVAADTAE